MEMENDEPQVSIEFEFEPVELTVEQQFEVARMNAMADQMTRLQAIQFLKLVHQQLVVQKALYTHLIKHRWGIEPPPPTGL